MSRMSRYTDRIRRDVYETGLALVMLLVLRPAADHLPRRWARGLAQAVGFLIALSPTRGRATYAGMRRAFGLSRTSAFHASYQWLARPLQDFVILRRVLRGREDYTRWKVHEISSDAVRRIKESGQPFIVATGHFSRESFLGLLLPAVLPHRIGMVAAPPPPRSRDPFAFRMRLQYGQILDAMKHIRPGDLGFMFTGGFLLQLGDRLRQPGNLVMISVDAYWNGGGAYRRDGSSSPPQNMTGVYTRPFAGLLDYRVATGTAFLSRLSQCPIVPCVTFMRGDDTVVVEWGAPIPAPPLNDKDADIRITDQLLQHVERAVGSRPSQYVLDIGSRRRWNSSKSEWEPHPVRL